MHLLLVLAGALLCNAIPHLTAGLGGEAFPTLFAKPPGRGPSSPLVNVYWGAFNLIAGLALLSIHPPAIGLNADFVLLWVGALAVGTYLALHFGRVRRDD